MDYICGTREVARAVMEKMLRPAVRMGGQCASNTGMVVEFDLPADWAGKPLRRFARDLDMEIAWVTRGAEAIFPEEGFRGAEGDAVTALVGERGMRKLEKKVRGRRG